MQKIKITQTKSYIKRRKDQKQTLVALGLGRINKSAEHNATDQIKGMVQKLRHLIDVEEIK